MDKTEIMQLLAEAGVYKSGVASLMQPVGDADCLSYEQWLGEGRHGGMAYLEKYSDIRRDPRLLLPDAKSLISCAFNYYYPPTDSPLKWASYATGDDYHEVVRERLGRVADRISELSGAECRVCVDTAPLRERYWAVRAGLGFVGLNNQLIIPGAGSHFFLGEIITTLPLEADEPCRLDCGHCGRCVSRCPGRALDPQGRGLDARKCLSYLTIEHRGELPAETRFGRHIYGCDECQDACPHNANPPVTTIEEFKARESILRLSPSDIRKMKQEEFSAIFRRSAIKRTKLAGLVRNADNIEDGNYEDDSFAISL